MSVLKIDSSARGVQSNSRVLTQYLVDSLGGQVIERDLARSPLPSIGAEDLIDLHGGSEDPRPSLQQQLAVSDKLIAELMTAETLVVGVPIYNFGVPASVKQWVDYICRAGITFRYGENGPEGLSGVKRAFIVTSSGGVPIGSEMDFASGYMEQICRFVGINSIIHIDASGSKRAPEKVITQGKQQIDEALRKLGMLQHLQQHQRQQEEA